MKVKCKHEFHGTGSLQRVCSLCGEPAEPSPEVAPKCQHCNTTLIRVPGVDEWQAVNLHPWTFVCPQREGGGRHVPAVAPRETQPHSIQCAHCPHMLQYHLSGVLEDTKRGCTQCDCPGFEAARVEDKTPATQHRVIPVEWHRVAVEPGDACDCEDHPCPYANEQLQRLANTDDRTADTIPERVILLSQGQFAIVDADDFELLSQWKWNAHKSETGTWYAVRSVGRGTVRMHRVIMANPSRHVDHINGNGLDNRKLNLRIANQSQNMMNRGLPANNTSGFKGVTWDKKYESWKSQIKVNQKLIHLGNFPTPEEASSAYENAARLHFGEFYKEAK